MSHTKSRTFDKLSENRSTSRISSFSRNRLGSPDKTGRKRDTLELQLNEMTIDKKLHVSNIL
jgi:hypothetical protein